MHLWFFFLHLKVTVCGEYLFVHDCVLLSLLVRSVSLTPFSTFPNLKVLNPAKVERC